MKKHLLPIQMLLFTTFLPPHHSSPGAEHEPLSTGPTKFETRMSGTQENPPVATGGHGFFTATISADETTLTFSVTIVGMDVSKIFQAHIHVGNIASTGL